MNYFPLGATLLIKAPKVAEKTEGGILKSEAMKSKVSIIHQTRHHCSHFAYINK